MRTLLKISAFITVSTLWRVPAHAQSAAIDLSFQTGTGFTGPLNLTWTRDVAVALDGGIYVGGRFTSYQGTPVGYIVKMYSDGTIDPSFNTTIGANDVVNCIHVMDDGRLMIGGKFTSYNGVSRIGVARLFPDGSLDPSYDPALSIDPFWVGDDNGVKGIVSVPGTSKFMIYGKFPEYGGEPTSGLVRVFEDGIIDVAFDAPLTDADGQIETIAVQDNGKVVVGGTWSWSFSVGPWNARAGLVRFNADGALDPTFQHRIEGVSDPAGFLWTDRLDLQSDGRIIGLCQVPTASDTARKVIRFNTDGSVDPSFSSGTGIENSCCIWPWWTALEIYPDDRILVLGGFDTYNGTVRRRIARLSANGSLDPTFDPGASLDLVNFDGGLAIQPDGRIICGSRFLTYQGASRHNVVRIGSGIFVRLFAELILAGAYQPNFPGLQRSDLFPAGMLPLEEPYAGLGFDQEGSGGEHISLDHFLPQGNNVPVDWVHLQLRSSQDPAVLIATRNAILLDNGHVVDVDGISSVIFHDVAPGPYYVAIKHRNHLGAMTAEPMVVNFYGSFVDFTSPNTQLYGQNAMQHVNGMRMLWAGDLNGDGELKYVGQGNDRDPILQAIGGNVPTNSVAGYKLEDINLDGFVRYVGNDNDRDPILQNIGGSVPTNVRQAQLP